MKYCFCLSIISSLFGCNTKKNIEYYDIYPLIIPSNYNESSDLFPYDKLKTEDFVVTWVRYKNESISYILQDEYDKLNQKHPNWKRQAVENLRNAEYFHKFEQKNEKGRVIWISFMNELDAISSSKILLYPELSKIFPEGYFVATPNRAVGFAISNSCSKEEFKKVENFVSEMFSMHGTPNSKKLYHSSDFLLSSDVIEPINIEYSTFIIQSIGK